MFRYTEQLSNWRFTLNVKSSPVPLGFKPHHYLDHFFHNDYYRQYHTAYDHYHHYHNDHCLYHHHNNDHYHNDYCDDHCCHQTQTCGMAIEAYMLTPFKIKHFKWTPALTSACARHFYCIRFIFWSGCVRVYLWKPNTFFKSKLTFVVKALGSHWQETSTLASSMYLTNVLVRIVITVNAKSSNNVRSVL